MARQLGLPTWRVAAGAVDGRAVGLQHRLGAVVLKGVGSFSCHRTPAPGGGAGELHMGRNGGREVGREEGREEGRRALWAAQGSAAARCPQQARWEACPAASPAQRRVPSARDSWLPAPSSGSSSAWRQAAPRPGVACSKRGKKPQECALSRARDARCADDGLHQAVLRVPQLQAAVVAAQHAASWPALMPAAAKDEPVHGHACAQPGGGMRRQRECPVSVRA